MQSYQVALVQFGEARPYTLIRWNLGALEPVAASVLIEINTGVKRLVDVVDAETR
jgi:hypothetical protein